MVETATDCRRNNDCHDVRMFRVLRCAWRIPLPRDCSRRCRRAAANPLAVLAACAQLGCNCHWAHYRIRQDESRCVIDQRHNWGRVRAHLSGADWRLGQLQLLRLPSTPRKNAATIDATMQAITICVGIAMGSVWGRPSFAPEGAF